MPEYELPQTVTPIERLRPERTEAGCLDAFLAVPKKVVIASSASKETMSRVASLPGTRLGVACVGGNTLRVLDIRKLSGLKEVSLHMVAPVEAVHVEVLEQIDGLVHTTVRVPADKRPDGSLIWRLERLGPGDRHLILEGELSEERLADLMGPRFGLLTVDLPVGGFSKEQLALLRGIRARLMVSIPAGVEAEALATVSDLEPDGVVLKAESNRISEKLLAAVPALDLKRVRVRFDADVGRDDVAALRGMPGVEIEIWIPEITDVPVPLMELLAETEGGRPRRQPTSE